MDMKSVNSKSAKFGFVFASCLGLALATGSSALADGPIGVLGLYNVENPEAARFDDEKITSLGCELRREGLIAGAQGDIGIDQPNRFVLLACDGTILSDIERHARFNALVENAPADVILEGPIADMPDGVGNGNVDER